MPRFLSKAPQASTAKSPSVQVRTVDTVMKGSDSQPTEEQLPSSISMSSFTTAVEYPSSPDDMQTDGLARADTIRAGADGKVRKISTEKASRPDRGLSSSAIDPSGTYRNGISSSDGNDNELVQSYGALSSSSSSGGSGHYFSKRARQRSREELRSEQMTYTTERRLNERDDLPAPTTASSPLSNMFPFFGRHRDTPPIPQHRTTSSPLPTSAPTTRAPSPDLSGSALARAITPRASSVVNSKPALEAASNGKRRLTYLQDVVSQQQRTRTTTSTQNLPLLPNLPKDKVLPPIPRSSTGSASGQMPSRPSDIVVTPSSPTQPDGATIFWSDGPHNTEEAMSTQLDRQRTVRASLSGRHFTDTVDVQANRPKLRHVKSLGLGKPSLAREYSETSTIRDGAPSSFCGPASTLYLAKGENRSRSASSILLQPQFPGLDRSRSPSPTAGGSRSVSFTSPERPWRGRDHSTMDVSQDDLPTQPRKVIRKARSFSGMFSSSAPTFQPPQQNPLLENRRAASHETSRDRAQSTSDSEKPSKAKAPSTSLLKGAMEWLGSRKSSKNRKPSESSIKQQHVPNASDVSPDFSPPTAHPLDIPGRASENELPSHPATMASPSPGDLPSDSPKSWTPSHHFPPSTLVQPPSDSPSFSSSPAFSPRTSLLSPYISDGSNADSTSGGNSTQLSPVPAVQSLPSGSQWWQETTNTLPPIDAPSPLDAMYFSSYDVPTPSLGSVADTASYLEPKSGTFALAVRMNDSPPSPRSSNAKLRPPPIDLLQQKKGDMDSQLKRPSRQRAHSDAPSRIHGSSTQSTPRSATSDRDISQLFGAAGGLGRRPTLGERSNSAGSLVIGRVKSAMSSRGRGRSNSLLRTSTGEASPRNSSRSFATSPSGSSTSLKSLFTGQMSRQASYEQGQQLEPPLSASAIYAQRSGGRLTVPLSPTHSNAVSENASPRPSFSSSVASSTHSFRDPSQPRRHSAQTPDKTHSSSTPSSGVTGRARSSTVSVINPSPSKQGAVSALRKKPGVARRLSVGIFGSPQLSSKQTSLFPMPGRTASETTTSLDNQSATGANGASASGSKSFPKPSRPIPPPSPDEDPTHWLKRLLDLLSPSEVASALASKSDETYAETLRLFMRNFDFHEDALDISLRKLLMVVALPRETQQIDRVVEAFAKRYVECQRGLFLDPDHAYVLAFSLMMLHTDAFNKNNKHKMAKADYVKNTRLDGVPPMVLEVFFDNICYTPFVYLENEGIPIAYGIHQPEGARQPSAAVAGSQAPLVLRNGKLDIYGMIASGTLHSLRVDLPSSIPPPEPFSWRGTRPFFDFAQVQAVFSGAPALTVAEKKPRRRSGAALVSTDAGLVPGAVGRPEKGDANSRNLSLKVVKVGLLSRKDDLLEGGKKAMSRKWKSWSVILTTSQLIFLKDPTWALSLQSHFTGDDTGTQQASFPRIADFRPDEVFSLKLACGLFDVEYAKYANTFRLILAEGRQFLLQAPDEFEMNEWITLLNFAAAYKTASLKIRPPVPIPPPKRSHILSLDQRRLESSSAGPDAVGLLPGTSSAETAKSTPVQGLELKVLEFHRIAEPMSASISENLRIARNLAVLTPFQKGGKERIDTSLRPLGDRIRHSQLELARLQAWICVLEADIAAGQPVDYATVRSTAGSTATTRSLHPASMSGTVDGSADALNVQADNRGLGVRQASSATLHQEGQRVDCYEPGARPDMTHRTSSASFHTAWEREVALPSQNGDADASATPPELETLQSESDIRVPPGEVEDWQQILVDKRRSLAEVPTDGLQKLSLRMATPR